MKNFKQATVVLSLLATSSPLHYCNGFSANNQRRPKKDFSARIVEEVVVKSVTPQVQNTLSKSSTTEKQRRRPRNQRQKSISQRDPIISLNMNLDYLAKSGQRDAHIRAEEMLQRIEALHEDGYYEKSPDVCSYNSVINAYGKVNAASGHARRLMKRMEEKGINLIILHGILMEK